MANTINGKKSALIGAIGLVVVLAGLVWAGGSRIQSIEGRTLSNEARIERVEKRILRDIADIKEELKEMNRRLDRLRI